MMFYGTKFYYKLLYYLTSMSPSYLLFILQLNDEFENVFERDLELLGFSIKTNIYSTGIVIFFIVLASTLFLKWLLINQYKKPSTDQVLGNDKNYFSSSELEEINGGVMPFILGNILPTVVIAGNNAVVTVISFLTLQVLLFVLIVKSTDVFPNVMLIIFGINLCKTKDNRYVFTFNSNEYSELKIYQIGDLKVSKTYITMYDKKGVGKIGT